MSLVATILDSPEHFHRCRNFDWTAPPWTIFKWPLVIIADVERTGSQTFCLIFKCQRSVLTYTNKVGVL